MKTKTSLFAGKVASSFNIFFYQVGSKLAAEFPSLAGPPLVDDAFHRLGLGHEFRLEPVSGNHQVENVLWTYTATLLPVVTDWLLQYLSNSIKHFIQSLQHIINCSLTSGIFPDALKIAKVNPIFKSCSKSDMNSYRPISLLSVFSKVLKKIFKQHLQQNSLVSERVKIHLILCFQSTS